MRYDVITLFPKMIKDFCSYSMISRALKKDLISVNTINPRDFSELKHKRVDDTPYGGGVGMVLMCDPIFKAYESIERLHNSEFIMLSPHGEKFDHKICLELSEKQQLILLCGHYEGFDERIKIGLKPREISLGDFILTGGELAAMCIIDSVSRQIEGVLGKFESAQQDSFSDGMLKYPQYTKPREYRDMPVPDVLLNGNHGEIEKWRKGQKIYPLNT